MRFAVCGAGWRVSCRDEKRVLFFWCERRLASGLVCGPGGGGEKLPVGTGGAERAFDVDRDNVGDVFLIGDSGSVCGAER